MVLNFCMWFKNGLKAQKLLAQGIALGIMANSKAPCFTLIEQALSVCNYSAPPMSMSNRLTVVLQQELH